MKHFDIYPVCKERTLPKCILGIGLDLNHFTGGHTSQKGVSASLTLHCFSVLYQCNFEFLVRQANEPTKDIGNLWLGHFLTFIKVIIKYTVTQQLLTYGLLTGNEISIMY